MECMVKHADVFSGVYQGRRVLVTGHTGFKGSWLALWLTRLGARVGGVSLYLPSEPCHFTALNLQPRITHVEADVRQADLLARVFDDFKPEIVFHLAAQPIVRRSYDEPKLTFDTNMGGTVNLLECVKTCPSVKAAVMITSDKCYDNMSWDWGYRENDRLGGDDPYSASKACAEIACKAYIESFFHRPDQAKIATTRAGNVIGGGDWATDRILPDCVRAWSEGKTPEIRSPQATRPWQHVLEPLGGYLWLGAHLLKNHQASAGKAFNFGPDANVIKSVEELVTLFLKYWGPGDWKQTQQDQVKKEASLLKLCCDRALHCLNWYPILNFDETIRWTAHWYKGYYAQPTDAYNLSGAQIDGYVEKAAQLRVPWATERL